MNRVLVLILLVVLMGLLLLGCSDKPMVEPPITDTAGLLAKPTVEVTGLNSYNGIAWMGESYELTGQSLVFPGDGFSVSLQFAELIDADSVPDNIRVEGCEDPSIQVIEDKVHLHMPHKSESRTYIFHMGKGVKAQRGDVLGEDLVYTLEQVPHPKAYFTLTDRNGTFENVGEIWPLEGDWGWYNRFTTNPKTFIIDFTSEVDKASVEKEIGAGLGSKVKIAYDWPSPTQLKVECEGFEAGYYIIDLSTACDINGYPILGNLFFTAEAAQQVWVMDIETGDSRLIKEFSARVYAPHLNRSVDGYLLFSDLSGPSVLDVGDGTMRGYAGSHAQIRLLAQSNLEGSRVLSDERLMYWDRDHKQLMSFSLRSGQVQELFAVSELKYDEAVCSIALAPSRDKWAVITHKQDDGKVNLYVYDGLGRMLYQEERVFDPVGYIWDYVPRVEVSWLDDNHIVYEERMGVLRQVVILNTVTGKREVVSPTATAPEVLGTRVLKFEKYNGESQDSDRTVVAIYNGQDVEVASSNPPACANFCMLVNDRLAFNQGADIVLFDLREKRTEVVAQGEIIGTSTDGRRLYYITKVER